jgi:hypothetical protein
MSLAGDADCGWQRCSPELLLPSSRRNDAAHMAAPLPWRSSIPFTPERVGACAIYCSDGRYNEQFDEFLHRQLQLPRYDRLCVPGGAAALAGRFASYREEDAIEDLLRLLIDAHALERVVLIAHMGCGYYQRRMHVAGAALRAMQVEDLGRAAARVRNLHRELHVDGWFAALTDGNVVLEPLAV